MANDRPDNIEETHKSHLALCLLLDTSDSMNDDDKIINLRKGVNRLIESARKIQALDGILDIVIVTFNDEVEVIQDFQPIGWINPIGTPVARGKTEMGEGVLTAIGLIRERVRMYNRVCGAYVPVLVMVTDGNANGDHDKLEDAIKLARQRTDKGKLKFLALGVGNFNRDILSSLTNDVHESKDFRFDDFMDDVVEHLRSTVDSQPADETP